MNKSARHNNCMGDFDQAPNIAAGRGTVVKFQDYPHTARLRAELTRLMNAPTPLVGELNHYFDANKCGIGWHGACAGLDAGTSRAPATHDSPTVPESRFSGPPAHRRSSSSCTWAAPSSKSSSCR